MFIRLESGRNLARKLDFRPGSIIVKQRVGRGEGEDHSMSLPRRDRIAAYHCIGKGSAGSLREGSCQPQDQRRSPE